VHVVELNEPLGPVSENVTVPVGVVVELAAVSLTVALQIDPWFAVTELGEQATTVEVVCWPTRTCTTSRWVSGPAVALIVTLYTPEAWFAGTWIVSVELSVPFAERFGLFGFRVAFGPAGFTVTWVVIPPWNPSILVKSIWEVPEDPGERLKLTGLAVTLKSGTLTVTFSVWTSSPLVPFTVRM
jgi:hypothetical protein